MKLRVLTGGVIAIHGLFRIIFIGNYIDFVHKNFLEIIPFETALTISSALFPFIEFFAGLLIVSNIKLERSILFGGIISIIMSFFIIIGSQYEWLVYHGLILLFLTIVYYNLKSERAKTAAIKYFDT